MKICDLCGENTRQYPVELMTDGIIERMLVCEECYAMVNSRRKEYTR